VTTDLFCGIAVSDYDRSLQWYRTLFGAEPAFLPAPTEAVWKLGKHRFVYIVERPERAGHGLALLFVDDVDEWVRAISARGINTADVETYDNGVRKVTYRDPDGNEFAFGGSVPA